MIRDDLDSLFTEPYRVSLPRLILALLLWGLLIGAGCTRVLRWTSTPPEDQPYSRPLRTRPPGGLR
jgi:hypothetical protein